MYEFSLDELFEVKAGLEAKMSVCHNSKKMDHYRRIYNSLLISIDELKMAGAYGGENFDLLQTWKNSIKKSLLPLVTMISMSSYRLHNLSDIPCLSEVIRQAKHNQISFATILSLRKTKGFKDEIRINDEIADVLLSICAGVSGKEMDKIKIIQYQDGWLSFEKVKF
jgi:hypothetical protein